MQNRLLAAFVFYCSLSLSASSKAYVGSIEEIVRAAKSEEEPMYIKDLIMELCHKLYIQRTEKEDSPGERFALILSVRAMVITARNIAWSASWKVAQKIAEQRPLSGSHTKLAEYTRPAGTQAMIPKSPWDLPLKVAEHAALGIVSKVDFTGNTAQNVAWNLAYNTANLHTPDHASFEELWAVSFRGAEYAALNYFLNNAHCIVKDTYAWALETIIQNTTLITDDDVQAWLPLLGKDLFILGPDAKSYAVPSLVHICPMDWVLPYNLQNFSRARSSAISPSLLDRLAEGPKSVKIHKN